MPRKRSPYPYSPGPVLKNRRDASATRGSASRRNRARIAVTVGGAVLMRVNLVFPGLGVREATRRGVSGTGPVMACCPALRPLEQEVFDACHVSLSPWLS